MALRQIRVLETSPSKQGTPTPEDVAFGKGF
jgi:hypothetical protein